MGAIADPIRGLVKLIPAATRGALEETFLYWHKAFAPEHFRRGAFGRYPAEYSASRKTDRDEWLRRHASAIARSARKGELGRRLGAVNPLSQSGRLEQAFLSGSYRFGGSMTRLRVTWSTLPGYATRANRFSGFQAAPALVAVSADERENLTRVYAGWLARNLKGPDQIRAKTFGRIVIQL